MTALTLALPESSRPRRAGIFPVAAPRRQPGLFFSGVRPADAELDAGPGTRENSRPLAGRSATDEDGLAFLGEVFAQVGLRIEAYRATALLRRLPACLRELGVVTVGEAADKLAARPALAWTILDTVLLGVTEFCRDQAVFEKLRADILPELGRTRDRLRIWSAACSEGQELYTVAACLASLDLLERSELLGTDCRPEAIARAREGEYSAASVTRVPAAWRRPLLLPAAGSVRIHPRLRVSTRWGVGNLLDSAAPGPWDLILCRNFAIYLEPAEAARLWRRLADRLAPGGFLVAGKAENPALTAPFERIDACLYRKR